MNYNLKIFVTTLCYFVLLLCICLISHASSKNQAKVISGWVEKIRIANIDADFKAKLDTGARTSSIHATNIKSFKRDGKRWVRFTLELVDNKDNKHTVTIEKERLRKASIKNHDGNHDRRYVVNLEICFNQQVYTTEFTLADRSEYIYGILLGRQFLKKTAVVDSEKTFLTHSKCNVN